MGFNIWVWEAGDKNIRTIAYTHVSFQNCHLFKISVTPFPWDAAQTLYRFPQPTSWLPWSSLAFLFLCNLNSGHGPFLLFPRHTGVSGYPKFFLLQGLYQLLPLCTLHVSAGTVFIKTSFSCSLETSPICIHAHCLLPTWHLLQPSIVYVLSCFPVYYPPLPPYWKHNETKDHKISHSSLPDAVK